MYTPRTPKVYNCITERIPSVCAYTLTGSPASNLTRTGLVVKNDHKADAQRSCASKDMTTSVNQRGIRKNRDAQHRQRVKVRSTKPFTVEHEEAVAAISGRWELQCEWDKIREDGRLQVFARRTIMWLRADGRAQYEHTETSTVYDGQSKAKEIYGCMARVNVIAEGSEPSDEFMMSCGGDEVLAPRIEPLARKFWLEGKWASEFGLAAKIGTYQNPGQAGRYEIRNIPGAGLVLEVSGRGWGRASAWENDDLGYSGGGAHPHLSFTVPVEELVRNFTRTGTAANSTAHIAEH